MDFVYRRPHIVLDRSGKVGSDFCWLLTLLIFHSFRFEGLTGMGRWQVLCQSQRSVIMLITRIEATATISFVPASLWLLIEGSKDDFNPIHTYIH